MPSTLDTSGIQWNPSGAPPPAPAGISDAEWERIINQLRTQDFYDSNPELQNIVPKSPGGKLPVGSTPAGPAPTPPLPASQVPATAAQGLVEQSPGVTGGILNTAAATAPKASTSALMQWLVPAISSGAGIAGSLIGKSANDNATEAQTEAADKSLALTDKMYQQDRADYAPYRNIGAYSLGQLGHLVGMPPTFGTDAVNQATQPAASSTSPPPHQSILQQGQALAASAATATPEQQSLKDLGTSLRDLGARQQTASSFVRMRAPDGEEADIHPSEVPLFEAHGAMRVG